VDREALVRTICAFSRLAVDVPELLEIELNPLVAGPNGAIAVDARARTAAAGATPDGTQGES
jgi:acetyltransferase